MVAIIGILSAIGVVSYQGYTWSAKKKDAELSLNSILLANEEYTSNNGKYYYLFGVTDTSYQDIQNTLFDGIDDLSEQAYSYKTTNANTLSIIATNKKNSSCTITITEKNKKADRKGC